MTYVEVGLFGLVVFQQVFWSYQIQRLVDKLMSKNYHEYELSRGINDVKEVKFPPINEPMEDMSGLNGFKPF